MVLTVAGTTVATAQVVEQKVGDNNLIMNQNAVLEIESTNRGLLLPRLELTATDNFAPLTAHVEGMTIYNTATAGTGATAVTPGYYYNDGTKWVRVATGADAKTEPWFVQNTSNEATANTDDIYQQGRVAVGFTDEDAVSDKQFEVKGDVKTEFVDTDDYIYGFQTAMSGLDPSTKENLMYVTDNEDLSAANHFSFLGVNKNNATFITMDKTGAQDKAAIITAANIPSGSGGVVGLASETSDGKYVNVGGLTWTDDVDGAIQTRQTVEGDNVQMNLHVRPKTGIIFNHSGVTGYGSYTFPKNTPTEGQVLVGGATTGTAFVGRHLEWKDLSELVTVTEPWKIQNTSNEATDNTDDIYQQGKVAVGFTDADAVSEKQLEVKGDFKTQIENGGEYVGMETNINGFNGALMYVSNNDDILSATEYDALSVSSFGGSILSSVSGQYASTISTAADDTNEADFSLIASRNGVNYSSIAGSSSNLMFETRDAGNENTVMDIGTTGVRFRYRDNSTVGNNVGDYIFPRDNGQPGQVLITNGVNPAAETAQLSWADVSDLVKAAMPKFFYMPSVEIPTHNTSTGILLTGTQTIDLYASYTEQFGFTGGVGQARSNNASTIPTIPADELDYFITYFDTDVFQNVAVSTEGVLTYSVKSDAVVTPKTFMNIVFKVRD
ncbi:hypothetical protein CDL10_03035 [Avrilella dinanensis]|uniref:Uncharacterized protein n=2 Tax=Avrilella dinanensis TaxID=2008672 RepID=A0A2M9R4C4_9FLAO|nr:hypothetical protein CDL10_03035 [Avrilella dinanensis]